MVVRFHWQTDEWREAYRLCTTRDEKFNGPVPAGYCIFAVMLAGGVGDLFCSLHLSRSLVLHDRLLPALGLVCVFAFVACIAMVLIRHRKRYQGLPATPQGEQQATFHEFGWNFASFDGDAEEQQVRPWSDFGEHRMGRTVIAFVALDGLIGGVPLRSLKHEQDDWLQSLIIRKSAAAPQNRRS